MGRGADKAWKAYRSSVVTELSESRQQLIQSGNLREFDRPRRTTGIQGQAKSPIVDEKTVYSWSVVYFFSAQVGNPLAWVELANETPQICTFKGSTPERAKLRRKLAEQVRTNVIKVLRALKLPEYVNPGYPGN